VGLHVVFGCCDGKAGGVVTAVFIGVLWIVAVKDLAVVKEIVDRGPVRVGELGLLVTTNVVPTKEPFVESALRSSGAPGQRSAVVGEDAGTGEGLRPVPWRGFLFFIRIAGRWVEVRVQIVLNFLLLGVEATHCVPNGDWRLCRWRGGGRRKVLPRWLGWAGGCISVVGGPRDLHFKTKQKKREPSVPKSRLWW
jgi:hypothetical protein